jgi:hypothetical protein
MIRTVTHLGPLSSAVCRVTKSLRRPCSYLGLLEIGGLNRTKHQQLSTHKNIALSSRKIDVFSRCLLNSLTYRQPQLTAQPRTSLEWMVPESLRVNPFSNLFRSPKLTAICAEGLALSLSIGRINDRT